MVGNSNLSHDVFFESAAEERFRLAVESCPSGMVMTDDVGNIVLVNTETERLFGYERDELIGQMMEMLVPERLRSGYTQRRAALARNPQPVRFDEGWNLFGRRRDGSEFPAEIGLNPIRAREGLFVLAVVIDITERKRMDLLKDEFVSTVSHELRTPLTSIAGSLGLLVGGAAGELPEAALRLIRIAQSNSQRLVRLINDILDTEKIESGQTVFKFRRIDARGLIEQAIDANRGFADGFGVRVRFETATPACEIYVDADRLAQVFTNLLSNAIKFSPPDNEVVVGIGDHDGTIRITFRDRGPGIAGEFRPRIFEKFAQADATSERKKGGTGLGLSIARQIVVRLGGTIGFEDAPGGGTIFFVELPNWAQIAERANDSGGSSRASRILLCEDDPDVALALRENLRSLGFSVDFAHNPADAIPRVQATTYAVIVVDFDIPDGGAQLLRSLRERPQIYKTPIIALSADEASAKASGEVSGLNIIDWIKKPLDFDRVAAIIERAGVRNIDGQPDVLHLDDDPAVLELVAHALGSTARVASVNSIDDARRALVAQHFDLAILDVAVGANSGLDLLPELHGGDGKPVPVIIFSPRTAAGETNPQRESTRNKTCLSLTDLVAAVHDRLQLRSLRTTKETA
jgi:PAS domain S-box-containing protein